ncbi:MAG: fimbria/pilus periplasmic chaperone [Thermoanaerobaculia bacterium]
MKHLIRHLVATGALGLALCQAGPAPASTLAVSPVNIFLSAKKPSALLTIANNGDEDLSIEVGVFSWSEGRDGAMGLVPSDDIVVFPLLTAIPAHGERRVRIGLPTRAPIEVETTFRVFFEEQASSEATVEPGKIRLRARFGVPVFVQPARPRGAAVLESEGIRGGHLRFNVGNTGNAHVRLQSVLVKGLGAKGEPLFTRQLRGWYLLAGGLRDYDLALSRGECGAPTILIEARTETGLAAGRVASQPGACAP